MRWSAFWWSFCFAAANAGALYFSQDFPALDPNTWPTNPEAVTPWFAAQMPTLLILAAISGAVFVIEALLRGPIILALEYALRQFRKQPLGQSATIAWVKAGMRGAVLELSWALLNGILAALLILPSILALTYNPAVFETLARTGLSLWLSLILLTYAIKECALYYYLLSRVGLGPAIELGRRLLFRSLWPIFLFGLLLMGLASSFTFILNSVMLSMTEIFPRTPLLGQVVGILILVTPYTLFTQALRLVFFHALADTKTNPAPASEVAAHEKISETPA